MALNWSTSTDWNNAISRSGIIHDDIGDITSTDEIRLGIPVPNNTIAYHHYDDSSPFEDVSGNNNTADNFGTQAETSGPLGLEAIDVADGEYTQTGNIVPDYTTNGFTKITLIKTIDTDSRYYGAFEQDTPFSYHGIDSNGNFQYSFRSSTGNFQNISTSKTINDGNWHAIATVIDLSNQTVAIFVDGSKILDQSNSELSGDFNFSSNGNDRINAGKEPVADSKDYAGKISNAIWVSDTLSDADLSGITGCINAGDITTSTKSFTSASKPNLDSLNYNLNGQSIKVDVIGSPNTSDEEIVSQQLDGSSSYDLSWSNFHTEFRIRIEMATSDVTKTPTFNSIDLIKSAERYTSSISTFNTASDRYVSGVESFYTSGITWDISVSNISTDTATLQVNVDNIRDVQGAVFRFKINGNVRDETSVSATGTYETVVTNLSVGTSYTYAADEVRDNNVDETQSTQFSTLSETDVDLSYSTTFSIDSDNGVNNKAFIDALGNGTNIDISGYDIKDTNGNVLFSSDTGSSSQFNISEESARKATSQTITFADQTSTADAIAAIELLSSLDDSIVDVSLNENITGGQRIEIIIPIVGN